MACQVLPGSPEISPDQLQLFLKSNNLSLEQRPILLDGILDRRQSRLRLLRLLARSGQLLREISFLLLMIGQGALELFLSIPQLLELGQIGPGLFDQLVPCDFCGLRPHSGLPGLVL